MTTLAEIDRTLHDHLNDLKQVYGVAQIGVFGSFARGEQREESDVDILVELAKPLGFIAFIRLERYLQDLLGRKVDLVSSKALRPHIGRQILQEVRYVC